MGNSVNKSPLDLWVNKGDTVSGLGVLKSFDIKKTKTGTDYVVGVLENIKNVNFKCWSATAFADNSLLGKVVVVKAKGDDYNDNRSIVLDSVALADEEAQDKLHELRPEGYNADAYLPALIGLLDSVCPDGNLSKIFNEVLDVNGIREDFCNEQAAKGWHDAIRCGLLGHTYKVTAIGINTLPYYTGLYAGRDNFRELIALGCALHDIGKVQEYKNGAIGQYGTLVSHHTFGVELARNCKDTIVSLYNEEFYYRILSIIEQHHGEFEESPRTVEAFLVHQFDMVESRLQIVGESLANGNECVRMDKFQLR